MPDFAATTTAPIAQGWRVSFFFSVNLGKKKGGWTENYWNKLTNLSDVIAATKKLAVRLDTLHGWQSALDYARVSDANKFREGDIVEFGDEYAAKAGGTADQISDYPTNALLILSSDAGRYKARYWIRGVRDSVINKGGRYVPTSDYIAWFGDYSAYLCSAANGWAIRALDKDRPTIKVQSITNAGIVTTAVAHGFQPSDRVQLQRMTPWTRANGTWNITTRDAVTFELTGWQPYPAAPVQPKNGQTRPVRYVFQQMGTAKVDRASKHNVGRPSGLLIGRRKPKPIVLVGVAAAV